jgi:hypothetical protein
MADGLFTSGEDTWGLEGNSNAKLAITPYRAAQSWLGKLEKEIIGSWDELAKQFIGNFNSTYKRPVSTEELKACTQKSGESLRAYIQR